jgi:hypothetical protein
MLPPNFDLLEMTGSSHHFMADIGWKTISHLQETLWLANQLFLAN